jgi:hypothetical protein
MFGFRRVGGFDKSVELKYDVLLSDVPASQALYNLYLSCISAGFSVSLLIGLVEKRVKGGTAVPVDARFSVIRYFNGVRFYTGIISKSYIEKVVRLNAHVTPACTDFVLSEGARLLEVVAGWERPILVICQYPTKALYKSYEPLPKLLVEKLKIKCSPMLVEQYLPGSPIVDSYFKKIPEAKYPFTHIACSNSDNIDECTSEAILVALDEHVATLLYAVNTHTLHPQARTVTKTMTKTPEIQLLTKQQSHP